MSDKIEFTFEETGEIVTFYIIEETKINGNSYLLVTDTEDEEEDGECLILKDTASAEDSDSVYEIVEDEVELQAVFKLFEGLLEDITLEF